jgi:cytochrome c5
MSEHNNNPETKPVPGWVAYLFSLVLVIGFGATVYQVGFRSQSRQSMIREEMGTEIIKPTIEIIPVRDAKAIANGEAVYKRACSACHGQNLEGVVGPNLKDTEWYHPPAKETNLYKLVTNGISAAQAVKGVPMPAKGGASISGVEVWEVVYYLSSRNPSIEKDAVSNVK